MFKVFRDNDYIFKTKHEIMNKEQSENKERSQRLCYNIIIKLKDWKIKTSPRIQCTNVQGAESIRLIRNRECPSVLSNVQ
jgi:hypothetical protein